LGIESIGVENPTSSRITPSYIGVLAVKFFPLLSRFIP